MSLKRLAPVTAPLCYKAPLSEWQHLAGGAVFRVQPATPGINISASALILQNYNIA